MNPAIWMFLGGIVISLASILLKRREKKTV